MTRRLFVAAGMAVFAIVSPCQATLTVGPGGYPHLDAALAVASPGDTIVVLPGSYPAFGMFVGVTVRAAVPGTVTVGVATFGGFVNVPPGQRGHLLDLGLVGLNLQGDVSVDGCHVTPGSISIRDAVVALQECTVQATNPGSPGLRAWHSEVTAVHCAFAGGGPVPAVFPPQPAIDLIDSRLRGSRLTLVAGPASGGVPPPALRGDTVSRAWLSDSVLTADPASCAIELVNGRHDRCTLSPNCSTLPAGFVLGVDRLQPLQNGAPFAVAFLLQPGMAVGVFADEHFAAQAYPELEQALLLPAATAFPLAAPVANVQGIAVGAWTVPAGPQFVGRTMWLQGFSGFAWPLQASPLVGGVVR